MLSLIWILIFSAAAERAIVTPEDVERLSGFAEHKKRNADYDKEREAGFLEYLNEKDKEAKIYYRQTKEQQALPKQTSPGDSAVLYKKDLEERGQWEKNQALARKQLVKENQILLANPLVRSISEEEELDIISKRPRFEHNKRSSYNSRAKVSGNPPTPPPRSRIKAPTDGGFQAPDTPSFPPPPSYEDFPPPPPPFYENEMGQGDFPPPPPAFDEFDADFPPPPPPPPMDFPPPGI